MSKAKQILTIDDLVSFCKNQKIKRFDANESGKQICVKVNDIATFEEDSSNTGDGFMHLIFKVCHAGENRNFSNISKNNLEKYKNTIKYRPVLASIITSPDDPSVLDFNSHDIEIDSNGNPVYIERQVGSFTSDEPFLKYDEENDKTYLMAYAVIPEEYTAAADIIRRKGGTKVSCEIAIDTMQYNEDTGILDIIDFSFLGVCLLGDHISEGMAGSRADIESINDFSADKNSVINNADFSLNNTLIDTLKKLNDTLEKFNNKTDPIKEGGENAMNKFDELLELYGLTAEEIEFSVEGLSDEELSAAFTEAFGDAEEFKKKRCSEKEEEEEDFAGCGKKKKCSDEEESEDEDFAGCGKKKKCSEGEESEEEDDFACGKKKKCAEEESEEEDFAGCGKKKRCSVNAEAGTVEFEMSHDDIRMALYSLIESGWEDDSYDWICEVYDNYFIYQHEIYNGNEWVRSYYKQGYSKSNDSVELSGDAVEVFPAFVTESEKTALDMMRTQYEELKAFKENIEAQSLQAQKDEIFNDEKFAILSGNEKFAQLKKDAAKFSVEEVETKAKLIFAEEIMAKPIDQKSHSISFNFAKKEEKKKAYGNLFDK